MTVRMTLLDIFLGKKRLWQQRQEIDTLRAELDKLRLQNSSMREGMRRCVTCEYRIDVKQRQDENLDGAAHNAPASLDN